MLKKIFLICFSFLACISSYSDENNAASKKISELTLDLLERDENKKQIHVSIPSRFVVLNEMQDGRDKMYEFIPEGDRPWRWSEIITVMQSPCYGKDLSQYVRALISGHVSRKERCTNAIVEENGIKIGYITAEMPAVIPSPNQREGHIPLHGKKECLAMRIIEESGGFTILQYSKRYDARLTREEVAKLKDEMIEYLKSCEIR